MWDLAVFLHKRSSSFTEGKHLQLLFLRTEVRADTSEDGVKEDGG